LVCGKYTYMTYMFLSSASFMFWACPNFFRMGSIFSKRQSSPSKKRTQSKRKSAEACMQKMKAITGREGGAARRRR